MEKCDFYHIIVLSLNFPGYPKWNTVRQRWKRDSLAVLVAIGFVGFLYMVWLFRLGNGAFIWVMSRIPDAPVSGFESDLALPRESG